MLRRLASLLVVVWALGFVLFAVTLPQAAPDGQADAVIVLTGGEGRIARGIAVLRQGQARMMLVSGVDPEVKPLEFQVEYKVPAKLMACCITLGYESVDTRSNAREAAQWIARHHPRSVRLVTSDWHMRRAAWEIRRVIPPQIDIVEDAVPTRPSLNILFVEYSKLIARRLWHMGVAG